MDRLKFATIIGSINCSYYFAATAIAAAELEQLSRLADKPHYFPLVIAVLVYGLVMTILSALMILGAIKRRPAFIALWLVMSAVGMVAGILYLMITPDKLPIWDIFSSISFIATQSISWYSIYLLWKYMNNGELNEEKPEQTQEQTQEQQVQFTPCVL